jgi:hypothetical protein
MKKPIKVREIAVHENYFFRLMFEKEQLGFCTKNPNWSLSGTRNQPFATFSSRFTYAWAYGKIALHRTIPEDIACLIGVGVPACGGHTASCAGLSGTVRMPSVDRIVHG